MRTVWKFPLQFPKITLYQPITRVLHAGLDPATGDPAVWCEVDTDGEKRVVNVWTFGTGTAIPDACDLYVGTIVGHEGKYVWQVYAESFSPGEPNSE